MTLQTVSSLAADTSAIHMCLLGRKCRYEADQQKCQKREAAHDAYRAANQLRMASRKALEWIGMFEGPAVIA